MAYGGGFGVGFGMTPWVQKLLIANGIVFLLTYASPAIAGELAFAPILFLRRPWTILTYMFVHASFFHLFFNMLMLFFFGPPLESRWGSQEFIKFYIAAGLAAALLGFIFAFDSFVVGASGAMFGVMVAFALYWPNAPIYIWGVFPVPAKVLVGIMVGISFLMTIQPGGGMVAHFAHFGGALFAILYIKVWGVGPWAGTPVKRWLQKRRMRVVEGEGSREKAAPRQPAAGPARRQDMSREEHRVLDELDRVLDKISNEGMASLTPQERKLLDEVSRKYRKD
jgi:membrane associated rhomboid family serine protease